MSTAIEARPVEVERLQRIRERVAAGIAYLDADRPDWITKVDPDTIDVSDPLCCPAGQVYGSFNWLPFMLSPPEGFSLRGLYALAESLGFDAAPGRASCEDRDFAELTQAWREAIEELRSPTVSP